MNTFDISKEELAAIAAYIDEGSRSSITDEAIAKIFYAEGQIRSRLLKEAQQTRGHLERATEKLGRIEEAKKEKVLQGDFAETGLDSVDVAACLLYNLQQTKAYKLSKSKLQYILFEMYATWLRGHKERLFIEHPVCTEYGPQFWRVYKKIESVNNPVGYDAVKKITEMNPGVAVLCKNAAAKYYDYSEGTLKGYVCKCDAYKAAYPKRSDQKWNGEMDDRLILAWKDAQKK